jgi:hypothetical protein
MTTQTLDLNNIERKIFWTFAALLGATMGFYLYSVASLTIAVVDRDHMSATAHELAAKAADTEREYLAQSNSITLAYAQSLGFQEVPAKFAGTESSVSKLSIAR